MAKSSDAASAVGMTVLAFVAFFVSLLAHGWVLMIVLGIMHSNYPEIPALGFGMSCNIVMLAYILFTPATSVARNAVK